MKVSCFKEWCHVAKTFYDLDGNTAKTVGASCTWSSLDGNLLLFLFRSMGKW